MSPRDCCRSCFHPYKRCFITFDILPLIEFQPLDSISHQEALSLICKDPSEEQKQSIFFNESINCTLRDTETPGYAPVRVDRKTLESFNREVIYTTGTQYYKNMIPEIGIAVCRSCNNFFHEEDFEYECLKQDGCPFCRSSESDSVSPNSI